MVIILAVTAGAAVVPITIMEAVQATAVALPVAAVVHQMQVAAVTVLQAAVVLLPAKATILQKDPPQALQNREQLPMLKKATLKNKQKSAG
jgi:hypothetical protein